MTMPDFALGQTLDFKFTSRGFTTGAPFTLAGSPAVAAYPDNSITEITAGITLTVDFDSRTGLNNVRVVATGGNGYASGVSYALVITAGTVDSVSVVGEVVAQFTLDRQSIRPTTAGRTLTVESDGMAHADVKEVGGTTQTARDIGASVLLSSGTGTGQISLSSGTVTVGTNNDKTGYSLTQSFPSNFSALSITAGGLVTLADSSITSAKYAANAITAAALATDAVEEIADQVWDENLGGHLTGGSAGKALRRAEGVVARDGTAQAGGTNTITLDAGASSVNDFYVPGMIALVGGLGAEQFRRITAYNGTTKVATVATNWATAPDNTTDFLIFPWATVRVTDVDAGAITAASFAAGAIDAAAIATDAIGSAEFSAAAAAKVLGAGDIDGYTLEDASKLILSVLAGKLSGAGTGTEVFRAADDSKNRVTSTIDGSGNRTAVTLDGTG